MKKLIVLMLFFSVFMGVSTNIGWISLYGAEFSAPLYSIKSGSFTNLNILHWIVLLLSHILVFSLLFLTKNKFFLLLLVWFPLQFILVFASFNLLASFFLAPFIIVWIIAVIKQRKLIKDQ